MRIKDFYIEQFGILNRQKVEGLSPRLNIFLGHNEAGKSTLLHFFRTMFFGYKGKKLGTFDPSFAGKSGGGSLVLETCQGQALTLARRPGTHGGPVELHGQNGALLSAEMLPSLLGGYTAALYDQVFCFGLQELSSLTGMGEPQVAGALHAAAFGQGFKSPVAVLKAVKESGSDKLFLPKGRTQPINTILLRLDEIDDELRRVGSELEQYNALNLELSALQNSLEDAREANLTLRREFGKAQSLGGAWAEWLRLRELEAALAVAPKPAGAFGPDSLSRLEAVNSAIETYGSALAAKHKLKEQAALAIEKAQPFMSLSGIWADCQTLQAMRGNIASFFDKMPHLERQAEQLQRDLQEHLHSLGQGWNVEKAMSFDDSLLTRQSISSLRQRLESTDRAREQAEGELRRLSAEAREAEQAALTLRRVFEQPALERSGAAAFDQVGLVESGLTEQVENITLYSPEARALLEQRGRQLAAGGEALKEATARYGQLQDAERQAVLALDARQAQLRELQGALMQAGEQAQLQDGLVEFKALHAATEQRKAELAAAEELAATVKPPLFGPSTARKDTRRVPWLLLCVLLAILCFSDFYAFFGTAALGETPLGKLASLQAWQTYLRSGWLMFGLGLAFTWGALYWLSPRVATFGKGRFKPDVLRLSVNRLQADLADKARALENMASALLALPAISAIFPNMAVYAADGSNADRLQSLARNLETSLQGQAALRGRAEALAEHIRADEAALQTLAQDLGAAQEESDEARNNQEQRLALWDKALAPYSLSSACRLETVLRIFDLGETHANRAKKYLAGKSVALAAADAEDAARSAWSEWLRAHGFSDGFDPATVLAALEHIAIIKNICRLSGENDAEISSLNHSIGSFAVQVRELGNQAGEALVMPDFSTAGVAFGAAEAQALLGAFDGLYRSALAADAEVARLHERRKDLERLDADILEAETLLAGQQKKLAALLGQGHCADSGEYALRFEQYQSYTTLAQAKERSMALLAQAASVTEHTSGEKLWRDNGEFFDALQGSALEALQEQINSLGRELEQALQNEKSGHTRLGELKHALEALGSGQAYASLRAEASELQDELEALARAWSVQTLAASFIKRARHSFEEERQDSVIRFAGEFFTGMTSGSYKQMLFELDENKPKAFAVSENGIGLDSGSALSQGTREQLYLALRLAFIRQHNLTKESLPLIMDDILVNFDPARAENTAAIFGRFCIENQGLFFTCHPHTAAMLQRLVPEAALFNMEKGRISRQA